MSAQGREPGCDQTTVKVPAVFSYFSGDDIALQEVKFQTWNYDISSLDTRLPAGIKFTEQREVTTPDRL
jgi:hypothetical protein